MEPNAHTPGEVDAVESRPARSGGTPAATVPQQPARTPASGDQLLQRRQPRAFLAFMEAAALPLIVVLLCIVFSTLPATSEVFLTSANIRGLAANQAIIAVLALAAMVPLICGEFDVSVGALPGLGQIVVGAAMSNYGLGVVPAVLIGIAVAALVGCINGLLVAHLGLSSLITTLGMGTLIGGVVLWYTDSISIVSGIEQSLTDFGLGDSLGVPNAVWVVAVVAVSLGWVLRHVPVGRYLLALGSSRSSARLVGLPVNRLVVFAFVLTGVLAGIAGALQVARTGSANPTVGVGYTLPALSAAFLGATAIHPGRFSVLGTLVGVTFVAVSVNGLVLAGAADWADPVFNGAALVVAVALSTLLGRSRQRE